MVEVESEFIAQLQAIRDQLEHLTRRHQRALFLREVYGHDPLTRERFGILQADLEQYAGKVAELREEERLVTGWLARSQQLRAGKQGAPAEA